MYMYYYGYLYYIFNLNNTTDNSTLLGHIKKYTETLNNYNFPHPKQEIIDICMVLYEELFYYKVAQLSGVINKCEFNKEKLKEVFYGEYNYTEEKNVGARKEELVKNIQSYFTLFEEIIKCGNESSA